MTGDLHLFYSFLNIFLSMLVLTVVPCSSPALSSKSKAIEISSDEEEKPQIPSK